MIHGSAHGLTTPRPDDWRAQAACLGQWDEMHPDNDEHEIAHAKAICKGCPVTAECFWDAVRTGDNKYGIRAGLRANERRDVIKELRRREQAEQQAEQSKAAA